MSFAEVEARTNFVVERLVSSGDDSRSVVRDLAKAWPDTRALALVFALTDAAARIETLFDSETESRAAARTGYRLAALLAADVYAIEASGIAPVGVSDLQRYWHEVDPYFLTL
ncbi:hypothetical protein [Anianabacter salinae]|uniref:hypothetical protein n=1 Tax=Anianabacter salinae TaxID=2851023 RepID=UPI00225DF51D|nr:hypothetical protein [Anianabacter salinae]MBV0913635.1 hypothetical protein [Anianabacter salinae]